MVGKLKWQMHDSMSELNSSLAIQLLKPAMLRLYKKCALGFNAGTDFVSFNLSEPIELIDRSITSNDRSIIDVSLDTIDDKESLIVSLMHSLSNIIQVNVDSSITNEEIKRFANVTGVAITKVIWTDRKLRLMLCSLSTVQDKLNGLKIWQYAPCASLFFPSINEYVNSASGIINNKISDDVISYFSNQHYILDSNLKLFIENNLSKFFLPSIEETVSIVYNLQLYLWGPPGIGKSTFVSLFGRALQSSIRSHLHPTTVVRVITVPLNSIQIDHFASILHIRGLSDWSVERLLEQSIVKENLAILHLEENPDIDLQQAYLKLVYKMLDSLFNRYPDKKRNVIVIITSNYEPSSIYKNVIRLESLSDEVQRQWAKNMLANRLKIIGKTPPAIVHELALKTNGDMRPLVTWYHSLAFYFTNYIEGVTTPPKTLNGYMYFDPSLYKGPFECLVDMAVKGHTSPAVAVVRNEFRLAELIKYLAVREDVAILQVGDLLTEQDKIKIYGYPGEIRGGLTKFIDDHNNPNITTVKYLVVIVATVSEIGQFMLRELIETNVYGRTHRTAIRKSRVLYLLCCLTTITPQILSRSHYIDQVEGLK